MSADQGRTVPCGQCEDGCIHGTTTVCPNCRGRLVVPADQGRAEETLAERDARLNAWLADLSPGDIVTVRLNSTDTLTGKVYEAPDARGTSLCVWTTVLRHGNGYPGGSYEPVTSPDHGRATVLNEAADALEGGLGLQGTPRTLWEFRQWLRDRAALATHPGEIT